MGNMPQSVSESTSLTHQVLRDHEFNPQDEDEEEVEELEEEIKRMAQKILHYRSTFPDDLRSALASLLTAQRPQFPVRDIYNDQGSGGESCEGVVADVETTNGIALVKEKISNNVSSLPLVLKRMNECIYRINKLSSCNDIIDPAFKRWKKMLT